jgi:hypothetical protein
MDDSNLIGRLDALASPDLEGSRERAATAIPGRVRAARTARARRRRQLAPRLAAAVIAICLVLASLTLFTPPGRAVSSWVGDQLGFGRPGEHPTLRQLRHKLVYAPSRAGRTNAAGQAAYVVARGPMPHEAHWELITFRSNRNGVHCFEVEIAKLRQLSSAGCEEKGERLAPEDGLKIDNMSGNSAAGMKFQMILGRVSPDVEAVRVEFRGRRVPVTIQEPPSSLLEELGFHRSFKVFAAFPEGTEHGGTLTVTEIKDGEPVGPPEERDLFDTRIFARQTCRSAERLAGEGKLKEFNARRTCRSAGIDPRR